jgi:vitamin B12 transporter
MRAILFAAGILGGALPVLAQSGPATPPSGTSDPSFDESIVVTATLEHEAGDEVPATVTVIDRAEIEARQETSVADLLRAVPGVEVSRSGSPGKATSVFIRGANSNQTLVLWNGVRLNDPYFGGFDWSFLPTEGVSRIEVVRGPYSALYGSQAIGGVVQVLTAAEPGASLSFEGGSRDYLRGAATAGFEAGRVHVDVAGHVRRGDGRLDNDGFDSEEATTRALWTLRPGSSVGLVARANRSEVGLPFDFTGAPAPDRRQERDSLQLAVPFHWQAGRWGVEAQAGHTFVDLSLRDPGDPFSESDTEAERTSARVVLTRHLGGRFAGADEPGSWAAAGVDWQGEEVTDSSAFGINLDGKSQSTRSAFGELFLRAGAWSVDVGLRHDDHDAFGGETSLKLGTSVALSDGLHLRASYGEGFRAPSIGDLYFPGFGNPDLRPETSESWELGADWRPGAAGAASGRWLLSAAAFHTDLDALIVFDFVRSIPLNLGRARSQGIEASLGYAAPGLTGRLSATYQDTEDRETGEPLLRRPDWSGELVATWRPAWLSGGAWTFNGVAHYEGDRVDFGGIDLPSYQVLDLAVAYQWTPHLAPRVRVENVLDEDYEEVAGFPAPGRAYVAGLSWEM